MWGLSLLDGLDKCAACLCKMVQIYAACLYKMVWIHVRLVSTDWVGYVWFVSAIFLLDKCVACLCNMVWICLDMRTCLSKMVGINVWFVSPTCFG